MIVCARHEVTENDFQVSAKEAEQLWGEREEQIVRHAGERDHEESGAGDPPEHLPHPGHDNAGSRRDQYWYFQEMYFHSGQGPV